MGDLLPAAQPKGKGRLVFLEDMTASSFKDTAKKQMRKEFKEGVPPLLLLDEDGHVRTALACPRTKPGFLHSLPAGNNGWWRKALQCGCGRVCGCGAEVKSMKKARSNSTLSDPSTKGNPMNHTRFLRGVASLCAMTILSLSLGCGTILYPERRGTAKPRARRHGCGCHGTLLDSPGRHSRRDCLCRLISAMAPSICLAERWAPIR